MLVGRGMLTCSKQGKAFGKFCFCESPWSNESRRFGQSLSLSNYHLPKCLSPFATIDLTQYTDSKVVLGKVGNQLIGLYAGKGPNREDVYEDYFHDHDFYRHEASTEDEDYAHEAAGEDEDYAHEASAEDEDYGRESSWLDLLEFPGDEDHTNGQHDHVTGGEDEDHTNGQQGDMSEDMSEPEGMMAEHMANDDEGPGQHDHMTGGEEEDHEHLRRPWSREHTKGHNVHNALPLIDLKSQQLSDLPNEAGAGPLKANSDTVAVLENRVYGVADDHLVVVDSCLRSSKFMYACGSIYCLSLFGFVDFDL